MWKTSAPDGLSSWPWRQNARGAPLPLTSSTRMAPSSWASMEDGHGRGSHRAAARQRPTAPQSTPTLVGRRTYRGSSRGVEQRDPDALASLFDSDAEFVNVTGLWWHDRASIRKAHAYGLERIFSASTLTVDRAPRQARVRRSIRRDERGDVDGTEGVVEDEHPYARFCAFAQYFTEHVGHAPRRAVVQLQGDRSLRRP